MATLPTMANGDMRKLSFAKVAAASVPKNPASVTTTARAPPQGPAAAPKAPRERQETIVPAVPAAANLPATPVAPADVPPATAKNISPALPKPVEIAQPTDKMVEGLKDLNLETKTPGLVVNGSLPSTTGQSSRAGNSQTLSDDNSQRADSSSDLGTKPPSLDGKSITSGTTFALDEKESLRPDDSASVKAAAEDDDSLSIRGSFYPGSRLGSEVAARFHRIQLGDMPPRAISSNVLAGSQSQGLATPQSGASEKQPAADVKLPLVSGAVAPDSVTTNGFLSQNPDEKLLEAMQAPKDRFFLLKLEQQVIDFVQDSKEPFMDLPPCNSFCRMLTHKLADYYHMTHSFEAVAGAVRIYRTPFCRIPPPLSSIAASTPSSSSPAPVIMPRKIMRRGEGGDFDPSSTSPSKATSEAGSDAKDKATSREKLTREEREEEYNRVRQRIFGNSEKADTPGPEGDDGVSRASSVSGKDRINSNSKRKVKRRDDSEHFETRSNYIAYPAGPQQPTWASAASQQYYPVNNGQYNGQYHQTYPPAGQPVYPPAYPAYAQNNGFQPQYNGIPTYPSPPVPQATAPPPLPPQAQQQPPQRYPTSNPAPPPAAAPYNPPMPSVAPAPQPAWQQPGFQPTPTYPVPVPVPARGPSGSTSGIPYAFGQLPANANPHDPKSQHPIPGSYNRQAFNPKTQSFVPGNGLVPMQTPASVPYGNGSPLHGSPQINPSHMAYSGYQQPLPPQGPVYTPGPAAGYNMMRQGSNNSMYHPLQQSPHPQYITPNPPIAHAHVPNASQGHIGHQGMPMPQQTFNHLPNYGNPATLPQKPSN
ncbi:hypothetical protein QBC37DRAFT_154687 [Rhypophila decipiens]|uniref:R3H domain-containing protein 1 n=1 Tax=Rhypophila decipiens TaxID=261697 RepID=A0AAN6YIH5_9PEZI|nr:hypothetical protein QBC37DRAFT_154687 [Rhypophila decipiens]